MYIAKARELGDPGAYNLAMQSALAIEAQQPNSLAALLLRGHALHSLHHFSEAERIARRLVSERGLPLDFGLLGDVLVDRGALDEAIENYQRMMDLRPDSHAYTRAAHVRYLKGDLGGALAAMHTAARAVSPRNRESFAWTWSKLAAFQLQTADFELALSSVRRALEVLPSSYPALRVQAQIQLASAQPQLAIASLRSAAQHTPHPEVLWSLIEALQLTGDEAEAERVRARLLSSGAQEDPRAFALYLATQGEQLQTAERLVNAELSERADAYSYETLAWVQSARGAHEQALHNARLSLAPGTDDPRLFYHAALVAERAGELQQSRAWLARAGRAAHMLLPSQRELLAAHLSNPEPPSQQRSLDVTSGRAVDLPRSQGANDRARRGQFK